MSSSDESDDEGAAQPSSQPAPTPTSQPTSQPSTQPTLKVGDAAPPLNVDRWIKGSPVTNFEPGTIYVVELWATWCGPCIAAMPDLTYLQRKFPKVVFIGVNVKEKDPAACDLFVKRMGAKMGFRVAADVSPGEYEPGPFFNDWMTAAGERGIPRAFVVDGSGKIALISHPGEVAGMLGAIVDNRFDPADLEKWTAQAQILWPRFIDAMERSDYPASQVALDGLIAAAKYDGGSAYAPQQLRLLISRGDLVGAEAFADKMTAAEQRGDVLPTTFDQIRWRRLELFRLRGDVGGLNAHIATLRKHYADDAQDLNDLAWEMVKDKAGHGYRALPVDLDLILAIANDANITAIGGDSSILNTLARVHAVRGELEMAAHAESLAIAVEENQTTRDELKKTLAEYRAGQID